jgi:GntR family transcriptional regulator/MocR family aminotransferase
MSRPRRAALLGWADEADAWIIEDDRDSDAWAGTEEPPLPIAAEAPDRTILVGSFNRLLFPGLCVAFLVAPAGIAERLRAAHATMGARASLAAQVALHGFIAEGYLTRHLRRRRVTYAERRQLLTELLGGQVVAGNGLHLMLPVQPGTAPMLAAALARERLGGADLDHFSETRRCGDRLLLGLGATPDQLRACAPRLLPILANMTTKSDR